MLVELASALQSFTQQVVDSKELSAESQKQVLDLLKWLIEETTKKKADRNSSLFKLVLQSVGIYLPLAPLLPPTGTN